MVEHAQDAEYQVNLPEFEGPLDLLLHLVKRHELDILNIPIGFVTDKYIEYLDMMRDFSVDIAGEYLLMAAMLVLNRMALLGDRTRAYITILAFALVLFATVVVAVIGVTRHKFPSEEEGPAPIVRYEQK